MEPEVIRSRPEAQIKAVLQTKNRICNDPQSIYLEERERWRRPSQQDFGLFVKDLQKKFSHPEEIEEESCTVGIEADRIHSAARLQKLSCLVTEQQKVYDNIIHVVKMADKDAQQGCHHRHPTAPLRPRADPVSPSSCSRGPRRQQSSIPRPSSAGAIGAKPSDARQVSAETVAQSFEYQQACVERFQDGRKAVFDRKLKKHNDLDARLDAAELRFAKQSRDKLLQQKIKICATQQKHIDHQKQFRELQRSQEKELKLLQAKCHPTAKKLARPGSSPANLRGSQTTLAGEKEILQEPVYQNMQQSHAIFSGALTKFQQYVAANEVRMDKLWANVAPGEVRRTCSKEVDENNSSRKLKPVVHEIAEGSRMLRSSSVFATELDADTIPELPPAPSPEPLTTAARYETKLAQCRAHEQMLEVQRLAKRSKDEANLAAHRDRGKSEVEQRGFAAELMVQAWEDKSDEAVHRRLQQETADDGKFFRKQELRAKTQAELQQRRQKEIEYYATLNAELHDNVISTGRRLTEENVQNSKSKQERKASKASAKHSRKLDAFEKRRASRPHEKELQAVLARKAAYEKQFQNHVAAETGSKLAQSPAPLSKLKKSASIIENLQARRPQSCTAPRSPPTLISQPEMNCTSSAFTLSATASDGLFSGSPVAMSVADVGDSATEPDKLSAVGRQRGGPVIDTSLEEAAIQKSADQMRRVSLAMDNPPSRRDSTFGQMYSRTKSRSAGNLAPSSPSMKRAPQKAVADPDNLMGSDASSGDDEELLQDIQARSSKWLSEARPCTSKI